ncbi:MAG: NAD(P)H-dependent glycerol-3-phosphate dehydrogenase [Acidobacteriota bacterium]
MKISVIGGGSWGTAFSLYLTRLGYRINLWVREEDIVEYIKKYRENNIFLPGFILPDSLKPTGDFKEVFSDAEVIFFAVPSKFCRDLFQQTSPFIKKDVPLISLTKGFDVISLKRISELMEEIFIPSPPIAVLSGPSFSREVAKGYPTAVVVASKNKKLMKFIQSQISSSQFRIYTNSDVKGVELAGGLKNVIAIAAGIVSGLSMGYNALASLMTRGIAEISRLGIKMGAKRKTFYGLAGIGDLILTCTGELSRNRKIGIELARGKKLDEIILDSGQVAEGVTSTYVAKKLSEINKIEMPITEKIYETLYEGKDIKVAISELMTRKLKEE